MILHCEVRYEQVQQPNPDNVTAAYNTLFELALKRKSH